MMTTKKYSRTQCTQCTQYQMDPPTVELFSIERLKKSHNVENYLNRCIPNNQMFNDILNNLSSLHNPCIEYIFNTWLFYEVNRNKSFLDTATNTYAKPLQFIFRYAQNNVLNSVIDYIINNNMARLFCDANLSEQLIHIVCSSKTRSTELIERVINVYIENGLRIDCPTEEGLLPIHLILKHHPYNNKLIEFILSIYEDNDLDFECATPDGWLPIHFICNENNFSAMKRMFDIYTKKGLDLERRTSQLKAAIHFLSENCGVLNAGIIYMLKLYKRLNKNIDLEWCAGIKPLHLICEKGTDYAIQLIFDLYIRQGLDYTCATAEGVRAIHSICERGKFSTIKFILDLYDANNLDLECETNNGIRPIYLIFSSNDQEASKYIIDLYSKKGLNISYKKNGVHALKEFVQKPTIREYILEKATGKRKRPT